jgi:hypothetical protein
MNELATAQHFALYAVLIVAALLTLEWVATRRTRVGARTPKISAPANGEHTRRRW